jgi:hypothetical protein
MLTADYQGGCERSPKRQFIFCSLKVLRFPGSGVEKPLEIAGPKTQITVAAAL